MLALTLAFAGHAALARPGGATDNVQTYSFAFQDADISAVAQEILGTALGIDYTVDPAVTGKMSFRIDQRLTRMQLLEAFEAALAAQDVALVHKGERLMLEPPSKARVSAGLQSLQGGVHQAGYQVLAVPLTYATPSEIAKVLGAIAPADTVVYADDKLGLLILGGEASQLQSALDTVKMFDRDELQDAKIRWFMLSKASAQTVAADLQKLADAAGMTSVSIVPLRRLNGLFVFARNPQALEFVGQWVERLDQASEDRSDSLWVYHPRNVSADALSRTLTNLLSGREGGAGSLPDGGAKGPPPPTPEPASSVPGLGGQGLTAAPPQGLPSAPGVQPGPPGEPAGGEEAARFSVDRDSNTLLVSAPVARWISIQRVLDEIDKPPRQILIEASILEVDLTRNFHFGVDWSVLKSNGRLDISNVNSAANTIASVYPGFSTTFLSGTIQAAVTALGANTDVTVVSAPKIVALDNHLAKLEVGDQVPIITQSAQSTISSGAPLINSVDYRDTGVILNVTPRISGENKVVLDVAQEVSAVSQTSTSSIDSPTIQERKLESTLILQDGGVVALGGLISTNKSKTISGIPFIENAPLIGSLFRDDTRASTRTELIVLLSVKILPDPGSIGHAMADLQADMSEIKARGLFTARP